MRKPIPPVGIRLPEDLKAWLKSAAMNNRRSVNAHVLFLIEQARAQEQKGAQQ
ncbi:Arc family DNA-binding protein [uncultured Aquabacterium sp.]|uniref:Arc family DNA-binding protein n=1 Tax=uncultured Aquabacterium sp. TaxID=158753 RepID=UPI0034597B72